MSDSLSAIEDLRLTLTGFRHTCTSAARRPAPCLSALSAAIETLGQVKPAKQITCPEEYIRAWSGRKATKSFALSARAIRFLHWEPTVVLDTEFHEHLDAQAYTPGAREIQGLVRACHVRWRKYL